MVQQTWIDRNLETMMDYLEFYNCSDAKPLHQAVSEILKFYRKHNIDLLKEVLALSGAGDEILHSFNKGEAIFLFNKKQKDLNIVRQQTVGGPSLVFSRPDKVQVSLIANQHVRSIVGYDANALYLHAIGRNSPCGPFTTYKLN